MYRASRDGEGSWREKNAPTTCENPNPSTLLAL